MLKKLLKYDIKGTGKSLIPFYGIVLLLSILVRLSEIIKEHFPITGFINAMMLLFFVIAVIAIVFYTFFVAIKRFYQTVLKDEGYLTNTLPVKRSNIVLSQILTALIFIITSITVMASSLFIAFYSKESFKDLIDFLNTNLSLMGTKPWIAYSYAGIMLILSYITYIIVFILALILGHQKSKNKIAYSFMYGIIIYCILQVISVLALGIAIIFDNNLIEVMNRTNVLFNEIIPIFIATGISSLITPFIGYLLSCKFINTKLNLE